MFHLEIQFFVKDPHRVHPTFLTPRTATSPLASTRSSTESLAPLRPLPSPKVPIFDNYTPRPSASNNNFSATKTLSTDSECQARNPLDLRFLSLQCLDDLQPLTAQAKFDRQSELNRFMFAHQHTEQSKQDQADSNNETDKNEDMRTFSMLATLWNSDTKTAVESDAFAAQQHTVLKSNHAAFVPQSPYLPTAATEQLRKMHGLPPVHVETTDPNAADALPYSSKSQQSLLATALDTQALSLAYNELVSLQGFQSNLSDRVLHFQHLRWLDLSHNKLCEVPAEVLALCPNLQHLSIAHNAFTESQLVTLILQVADALKQLTSLSLQNCPGSSEWQV
jgi:Leucine-rich repeat (LRR) protein